MKDDKADNLPAAEDDEASLFRRAVADARPLKKDFVVPERRRPAPRARFRRADEEAVLVENGRVAQRLISQNLDKLRCRDQVQVMGMDATKLGSNNGASSSGD